MLTIASNQETPTALADDRWQAVVNRDRGRDGQFVFAVSTTGIYCRPSCPARRPRPENVSFFADPAAAERAGFRACRRCRPKAGASSQEELVARATAWLDAHIEERVTLPRLAAALGVSPGHLQRTFTRVTGVSPRVYAAARRLESAKSRLRDGADVTSALHAAGYGSSSRFYAQARSALGMTPTSYKRGGEGMTMNYATTDSPIGRILVAATERGICAVSIGEDDAALEQSLTAEYPRATIRRDDEALRPYVDSVARASARSDAPRRAAARCGGDAVSTRGLAGATGDPGWRASHLRPDSGNARESERRARRCQGLRRQPGRARHSLSPRGAR